MTQPAFYTPDELADRFKVSVRTIRDMVKRGDVDGIRVGQQFRITADSVDAYIEANRVRPLAPNPYA